MNNDNKEHIIPWPTKPTPLVDVGLETHSGKAVMPDCPKCPLSGVCTGYKPLNPSATPPPCKTYTSYTEWKHTIRIHVDMGCHL